MYESSSLFYEQKGQAVIEIALIIPILFLLVFGMITIGWWLNVQQVVTNAAREGARVGALSNSNDQIVGAVISVMETIEPDSDQYTIGVDPLSETDPERIRGNSLTVQVTYDLPLQFPFLPGTFDTAFAQSVAFIEYAP